MYRGQNGYKETDLVSVTAEKTKEGLLGLLGDQHPNLLETARLAHS